MTGTNRSPPPAILDELYTVRRRTGHALRLIARLRRQIAAAEDLTRRTAMGPAARATATAWHQAIVRLDLAAARLSLGQRALDRYVRQLDGAAGSPVPPPPARAGGPVDPAAVAAGARAAGAVLRDARPSAGWRRLITRLAHDSGRHDSGRHDSRRDTTAGETRQQEERTDADGATASRR